MVTAEIALEQGFHAIQSDHVEYITGKPPLSLREVYGLCKGKTYGEV
jgi:NAD(P)H dehydrogenase (quinone)